jgi:RND superfamily putative drug exporter
VSTSTEPGKVAHFIRIMAVPIVLGWLALTVITNVAVPPLEKVGEAHTVGLSAKDAPSMVSMRQIGSNFKEFDSDSSAMSSWKVIIRWAPTRTRFTTS